MKKLFLISFEGMNIKFLNDFIEMGELKNFKFLKDRGFINNIKCSRVPYESSGLASVLTGQEDYESGFFSYWHAHNYDYIPKVHSSNEIKDKMFWNHETYKDSKLAIINMFGTHPVYEVNGCMLSYAMDRTLRYAYPNDLMKEYTSKGMSYIQDMGAFYKGQEKEEFIQSVYKVERKRHEICQDLFSKEYSVYVVNYTCIDRVCHFYMNEMYDNKINRKDTQIYKMYKYCDEILGEIFEYVNKCCGELILFSSVGFDKLNKFVEINEYLAAKGILKWSEAVRRPDWHKTIAYESVQGSHGININKKGVYAEGIVTENEYEKVLEEVISEVASMENPYNGEKMFSRVVKGSDFYRGNPEAPDIILEPFDWTYLPYGDTYWSDRVSRHMQTGWHRNESLWGYFGESFQDHELNNVKNLKDIYSLLIRIKDYL